MVLRKLSEWLKRHDIRRILRMMSEEDRQVLRAVPETALIQFHHGLGMFLRNGFRGGQFPWLCMHCRSVVEKSDEPMSFDALSTVALREIWRELQNK